MRRLAAFTCSVLLLAACSSSDDGAGPAASDTDSTTAMTAATSATIAAAPTTTAAPATTTTEVPVQYATTIDALLTLGRPIVLAHTAGEDEFPASTLFSFAESVKAGVDMLDLNINISSDGELIVQHDDTVDRNTDGSGAVAELTAEEIAELDGAYWFTSQCADCRDRPEAEYRYRGMRSGSVAPPAGYTAEDFALPTLRQLVERFPDIPLNIEIKGEGEVAMRAADELAVQLEELGRGDATVVASFEDEIVDYFHGIAPDVEVSPGLGVLTAYVLEGTALPAGMRILQLPPQFSGLQVITPELVARATADGYPIWVWPNDRALENLASYRDFLEQGVVGLNINFPAQGVQAVQEFTAMSGVLASSSAGCDTETPMVPGQTTLALSAAGLDGTFIQHLPPAYDGATALPVVIGLHGWSQPAALLLTQADLATAADHNRFVAIAPDITRPVPLWDTALDGADVAWLTSLLDTLETTLCVDTNRVFVTGMSNGAMMTSTVACVLTDRIAAVAAVAGVRDPEGCAPSRPIALLAFHGTADEYLAYDGGYGPKVADLPSPDGTGTLGDAAIAGGQDALAVPDRMREWAARNGCDAEPDDTPAAADVILSEWAACDTGTTQLYTVEGGGHSWPGSVFDTSIAAIVGPTTNSISATDIMWRFFREHPLAD